MNRPRNHTPNPIIPDPDLKEKIKNLAEHPPQSIVQVGDARVETIKRSNGQADRIAVRARSGQFTKMTTAVAHADAKQAQQFLAEKVKNAAGEELTRKQHMREALYTGMIKASQSDKGLNASVKAFAELNTDAALNQQKEAMVAEASKEIANPVRVVVVVGPENMLKPEMVDFEAELQKRKDRDAKGPSFAEVTEVITNPPTF